ncbi:hypothetical protein A2851_03095 [Candidatus Kaiserbacteria bacterium RIFCSPHIGHO2_01_FULL_53_29]|uniref:prephenate dehydratase n=1 Tax=Candidatus Kaiserbacteria bacterium RIFCSPHIGHO2_01_FULL_53_29 TaxID=1798480 RepID=A0A1F6CV89_9BACT|nr:MAG: hypothetical protein A2851_03095 [Candidatus Kaiserbacteria bacterium RIFCSPHIGHO2_01_FULL_53_29]
MRIGISGAKGSFSEEAARKYASKNGLEGYTLDYLISVENVLTALEKGTIDLGIFPIENLTGGAVAETVVAMQKHKFQKKNTFTIDIRQNLLALKTTKREEIITITSHEQALKQCGAYLKAKWPNAKLQEYEDTAKAAEDLAAGKLPPSTAVIASRTAAEVYGLQILEESIQDQKENLTSFIAATK